MNTKGDLISYLQGTIEEIQKILKLTESIEENGIYEFKIGTAKILGRVVGFTYGPLNHNVMLQVYATQNHFAYKQKTHNLSLYGIADIKAVSIIDFPLYIGWNVTPAFEKKIRKS